MSSRYIKFPYNAVEQANIKAQFAARAGFPNVIRAIDCTHIAIKAPSQDEFVYVNRKHFHSINVQIICDAQMQLTNIVARGPWLPPKNVADDPSYGPRNKSSNSYAHCCRLFMH
ncbi:putative nuclease HARBI1 [Merluccius polli]|uniref:Nuclease HARBI1 n=1 Tax=Merluccius polli TaxID=89951 RepID=A0AA47M0R8_MERPO|nr:putative nuclease HARBI1 [Merluccius polli]